jgi:type II secretory pathway pseudopilin PulG
MIKLIDLLREEANKILVPRRSKEERQKNYITVVQKKIQQYMKNGGKGDLDLSNTPITSLPDNLQVGGYLNLYKTPITSLPDNLKVGGYLDLDNTPITSLPNNLKVGGNLNLYDTPITSLPDDLKVGGNLVLYGTPISKKYTKEQIEQMVPGVKGVIYL